MDMTDDKLQEVAWQRWQILYASRRNKAFRQLIASRLSHNAEHAMKKPTMISNAPQCVIELTHGDSDPAMWIIRHATRYMWFKKRISSHWFNDEHQAMAFAEELKLKHAVA